MSRNAKLKGRKARLGCASDFLLTFTDFKIFLLEITQEIIIVIIRSGNRRTIVISGSDITQFDSHVFNLMKSILKIFSILK